jgi:hypothetical protein
MVKKVIKSKANILKQLIHEEVEKTVQNMFAPKKEPIVKEQSTAETYTTPIEVDMNDWQALVKYGVATDRKDAESVSRMRSQKINLKWYIDYEYKSWGLAGLSPVVPKQKIVVRFEKDMYPESTEQIEKEIEIDDVEISLSVPDPMDGRVDSLKLFPTEILIDDKGSTVYFEV